MGATGRAEGDSSHSFGGRGWPVIIRKQGRKRSVVVVLSVYFGQFCHFLTDPSQMRSSLFSWVVRGLQLMGYLNLLWREARTADQPPPPHPAPHTHRLQGSEARAANLLTVAGGL